jgi:hypothetical protein
LIPFYTNPDILGYAGFFGSLGILVAYYAYVHRKMLPHVVEEGLSKLVVKSKG